MLLTSRPVTDWYWNWFCMFASLYKCWRLLAAWSRAGFRSGFACCFLYCMRERWRVCRQISGAGVARNIRIFLATLAEFSLRRGIFKLGLERSRNRPAGVSCSGGHRQCLLNHNSNHYSLPGMKVAIDSLSQTVTSRCLNTGKSTNTSNIKLTCFKTF
jgi:hypothetical protein